MIFQEFNKKSVSKLLCKNSMLDRISTDRTVEVVIMAQVPRITARDPSRSQMWFEYPSVNLDSDPLTLSLAWIPCS